MIKILNLRFGKPKYPWEFKVGRTSPVGNPFYMSDETKRDIVCEKYKEWFYKDVHTKDFFDYLQELSNSYEKHKKLHLFCWCSPKRCHAETIKEYLENVKIPIGEDNV